MEVPDGSMNLFSEDGDDSSESEDDTYREIFDGVNDMILVQDPQTGEILDANSKCLEAGFTLEELKRMGVEGFSPKGEEYSMARIMHLVESAAKGEAQIFEWGFYDMEGRLHPTEVNLKMARIKGKNRLLAIVRDITERKKAQTEIRQAKQSFHNIVEKSCDGLIVLDLDKTVRFVNPAAERFFNRQAEEIVGKKLDLTIPDDETADIEIVRPNGEPGIGELRKTETEWEGNAAYLISIRDITQKQMLLSEREKLIEELRKALDRIQTLRGMLPICSLCKKIRDDKGYWEQIETYITEHSEAEFTHGLCPECASKLKINNNKPNEA